MNEKQEIQTVIDRYLQRREALSKQRKEIQLDTRYTPEFKQELLEGNAKAQGAACGNALTDIQAIVDGAKARFQREKRLAEKRAQSTEYRINLTATLDMLRLGASRLDRETIQKSLQPFIHDKLAVAACHGALVACGYSPENAESILKPVQDGEALPEQLDIFMTDIRAACTMNPVYGMELETVSLDLLLSRWNDDMTGKIG